MSKANIWKGCAAGMAGGLAATVIMTGFQSAWNAVMPQESENDGNQTSARTGSDQQSKAQQSQKSDSQEPTVKVADKVVGMTEKHLSTEGKKTGGQVVHYAFGTLVGAAYGTALEFAPRRYRRNPLGSGLLMGSALFAAADEVALPALRLTGRPAEMPPSMHLYGFVSHLVYGATAGFVTRTLRKAM
jgi:uncharacterized membrane protein YagU involved in acid resistance